MRNLLNFILRYQFFFLFLLLGTAGILLTFANQQYHQTFFINSANTVTGNLLHTYSKLTSYIALRQQNQELANSLAHLMNTYEGSYLITDKKTFVSDDTLVVKRFRYMHAELTNNSVNRRNNYITLNKGARHGVKPDMGLITTNGVAGIVTHVSNNFSVAMSLLHSDMMLSVKLLKNDHLGTLIWEGYNYRQASMTYIPPHLEINKGDTIVTSGFSSVFPENVFIGIINDWEVKRGETFITAKVDLALDFNKLTHVFIVKNLLREEQDELEAQIIP